MQTPCGDLLPAFEWTEYTVVYFVACGQFVKIGWTSNLRNRLASIATSSPLPVTVLGALEGGVELERALHERFAEYHSHREWFWLKGDLELFLDLPYARHARALTVRVRPTERIARYQRSERAFRRRGEFEKANAVRILAETIQEQDRAYPIPWSYQWVDRGADQDLSALANGHLETA